MTTVLVIDDSPSEMAKFRDMLARHNFKVLEAINVECRVWDVECDESW